jgi:hypothetical protein
MDHLFHPFEEYVTSSILSVGALYFVVFWGYMLKFSSKFVFLPFSGRELDLRILLFRLSMFTSPPILVSLLPCVACYTPQIFHFCSFNFLFSFFLYSPNFGSVCMYR